MRLSLGGLRYADLAPGMGVFEDTYRIIMPTYPPLTTITGISFNFLFFIICR